MTRRRVTIQIHGHQATTDGHGWHCKDESTALVLNQVCGPDQVPPGSYGGPLPGLDWAMAALAVQKLGAVIISGPEDLEVGEGGGPVIYSAQLRLWRKE
jgi:hypothetical protein